MTLMKLMHLLPQGAGRKKKPYHPWMSDSSALVSTRCPLRLLQDGQGRLWKSLNTGQSQCCCPTLYLVPHLRPCTTTPILSFHSQLRSPWSSSPPPPTLLLPTTWAHDNPYPFWFKHFTLVLCQLTKLNHHILNRWRITKCTLL